MLYVLVLWVAFNCTSQAQETPHPWLGKWSAAASYTETTDVFRWSFTVFTQCGEFRVATHTSGPDKVEILHISRSELEFLFHDSLGTHITISLQDGGAYSGTVEQPNNLGLPRGRLDGHWMSDSEFPSTTASDCAPKVKHETGPTKQANTDERDARDKACPTLDGRIVLGRSPREWILTLARPLRPNPAQAPAGTKWANYCRYNGAKIAKASVRTSTLGGAKVALSYDIPVSEANLSLYRKSDTFTGPGAEYRNISLSWNGRSQQSVINRWGLPFYASQLNVTADVDEGGELIVEQGQVTLDASLNDNIHLGGPLYLSGSGKTSIHYIWHARNVDWLDGLWRFDALQGLKLQVRRNGLTTIANSRIHVDRHGRVEARMSLPRRQTLSICGLELTLMRSDLRAVADFAKDIFELSEGALRGVARTSGFVESETRFALTWRDNHMQFETETIGLMAGQTCPDDQIGEQLATSDPD